METNKEIEEIIDDVEKTYNTFKNFDMIDHPPHDHHYYNPYYYDKNEKQYSSDASFMEKIKQELSVLEKKIPNSIFVRSYEHRIDLMRAAIIGPPNTPYHHCLFFFDIKFPKNYPSSPPKIHYLSYGIDLNPNLHLDGKVTITALLDSRFAWLKQNWLGSSNNQVKKWDPKESTLLHVLHAIQNRILKKLHSLEKYNKRIFVLTCQNMIKVLREPPRDFRDFVRGHFRKRAHSILLKFRENEYDDELMIDLFVRMFQVFERNGAYCKHHLYFLRAIHRQNSQVNVEAKIRDLESKSAIYQEEPYKVKYDSYNRERCTNYYCSY